MRAAIASLVFVASCALFSPAEPDYNFYVLTTPGATGPAPTAARPEASLAIENVAIPAYLDRDAIAIRVDENRVAYSRQARWAEPLDLGIERALRQELSRLLAPAGISVIGDPVSAEYLLTLDVQRFERRGSVVELWARWMLRRGGDPVATRDERIVLAVAAPTAAAATHAMSRALVELADRVREGIDDARS
jgi:uncharacterized protein